MDDDDGDDDDDDDDDDDARGGGKGGEELEKETTWKDDGMEQTYICAVIEVTASVYQLAIMPSVSGVVELARFCSLLIVDTHTVVFKVAMQLAVLKISNNFISYSVVHQTLANEKERSWKRQYATVIWKRTNSHLPAYINSVCKYSLKKSLV